MAMRAILCSAVCSVALWAQQPLLQVVFPQDGEVEVPLLGPVTIAARYPILAGLLEPRSPLPDERQADSVLPTVVVVPEYLADTALRSLWGVLALPGSVVLQSDTLLQFLPDTGAWDYGQRYVLWVNAVAMVRDSAGRRDTLVASLGPVRFTTVLPPHHVVRNTLWERSATLLCNDTICLQFNRALPQGVEVEQFVRLFRLQGDTAEAVEPGKYTVHKVDSTLLCIILRGVEPGGYWLELNREAITGEEGARERFPFVVPERALFRVRVGAADEQDSAVVAARLLPWLLHHSRFGRALGQELRLEAPAAVDTFCFWRWRVLRNGLEVMTVDTPTIVLRVDTCTQLALWELVAQYKRAEKDTIRLRRACVVDQEMEIDYDVVIVDGYADSLDMFTYTVWKLPWAHLRISVHRSDTTGGYYHTVRWHGTAPGYEYVPEWVLVYRPVVDCNPGRLFWFRPCMELQLQQCTVRRVCIEFVQEFPNGWDFGWGKLAPFDTCAKVLVSFPRCETRCELIPVWDEFLRFQVRLAPCYPTDTAHCWSITGWEIWPTGQGLRFANPVCEIFDSVQVSKYICDVLIRVFLRPRLDTLWIALSAEDGAHVRDVWEQGLIGVELRPPSLLGQRFVAVELSDTVVRVGYLYRCADTVNVRAWAEPESGVEVGYWRPPWGYRDGSIRGMLTRERDTLRHVFRSDFRLVSIGFVRPDGSVEEIPASELQSSLVPNVGMVQLGGHSRAWRQHDRTTQVYLTFSHPVDTATLCRGIIVRDWGAGGIVIKTGKNDPGTPVPSPPRLQDGEEPTIYGCRIGPGGNAVLSKGGNRVIITLIDSSGLFIPHWQVFEVGVTEELRSRSGARLRNPETVYRRTQLPSLEVRLRSLRVGGGYDDGRGDQEVVLFLAFAAGVDSLRAALRDAMRLPSNDGYYEVPNEGGEVALSRTLVTYAHGALTERTVVTVGFAAFEQDEGKLDEGTMEILKTVLEALANMVLDSVARSVGLGKLIAHVAAQYLKAAWWSILGGDDEYICSAEEVLRAENWWHGRLATLDPNTWWRWYRWGGERLAYFYDWHRIAIPALPLPPHWPPGARLELEVLLK